MPSINLLDPSLGIQTIMESPAATRGGIPEARPLASNVLREAGLEELYSPCNAHHLVEQALCPDAGDGDILRPEVIPMIPPSGRWPTANWPRCFKTRNSSTPTWA